MANKKQSDIAFLMMKQWDAQLKLLTTEQKGILLTAIYDYQCRGIDFESDDGMLQMIWATVVQGFEYNNRKYEEMCRKNRENIKKRWSDTTVYDRNVSYTKNTDIDIDKEIEKDIDIDIDIEREEEKDIYTSTLNKAVEDFHLLIQNDYADIMDEYDISHTHIKSGELCALYDIVADEPLERYLIKSHEYKHSPDPAKMILRWAAQDGNIKPVLGYGK